MIVLQGTHYLEWQDQVFKIKQDTKNTISCWYVWLVYQYQQFSWVLVHLGSTVPQKATSREIFSFSLHNFEVQFIFKKYSPNLLFFSAWWKAYLQLTILGRNIVWSWIRFYEISNVFSCSKLNCKQVSFAPKLLHYKAKLFVMDVFCCWNMQGFPLFTREQEMWNEVV